MAKVLDWGKAANYVKKNANFGYGILWKINFQTQQLLLHPGSLNLSLISNHTFLQKMKLTLN